MRLVKTRCIYPPARLTDKSKARIAAVCCSPLTTKATSAFLVASRRSRNSNSWGVDGGGEFSANKNNINTTERRSQRMGSTAVELEAQRAKGWNMDALCQLSAAWAADGKLAEEGGQAVT